MFVDDCINCKIITGPIDGSIFIRTSKNCVVSTIARQLRFRDCENMKVFTFCLSDPAVESSVNINFGPYNAFFPNLTQIFTSAKFHANDKNKYQSPYDFSADRVIGDGAIPHWTLMKEDEFEVENIVLEEMTGNCEPIYDGYINDVEFLRNRNFEVKDEKVEVMIEEADKQDVNQEVEMNQHFLGGTLNQPLPGEEKPQEQIFLIMPNLESETKHEYLIGPNKAGTMIPFDNPSLTSISPAKSESPITPLIGEVKKEPYYDDVFINNSEKEQFTLTYPPQQGFEIKNVYDNLNSNSSPFYNAEPEENDQDIQVLKLRKAEHEERMRKVRGKCEWEMKMKSEDKSHAYEYLIRFDE